MTERIWPVVIWAGGKGTRLQEETHGIIPKPMVSIGDDPLLAHIMRIYDDQMNSKFIIATGIKGQVIDAYVASGHPDDIGRHRIVAVDTGDETQTGGRLRDLNWKGLIASTTFMATYGDGLADVNFTALMDHHFRMRNLHDVLVTLTAVRPPSRFGSIEIANGLAIDFSEKKALGDGWINGGFYVIERRALDLVLSTESRWEYDVLPILAAQGRLAAYQHPGWWHMCDTPRDLEHLRDLWESGDAPWTRWRGSRERRKAKHAQV